MKDVKTHVSAVLTTEKKTKHKVRKNMQIFMHKATRESQNTEMYAPEFAGGFKTGTFFTEYFRSTEVSLF